MVARGEGWLAQVDTYWAAAFADATPLALILAHLEKEPAGN